MINYKPGDIVLVAFPFSSGGQSKNRPAMVVLDTGDADILVARVTTHDWRDDQDVVIHNWKQAGLLAPSIVRLHKLATLEKPLIQRRLGGLDRKDHSAISEALRRLYGDW